MQIILGINAYHGDVSAVLVRDGQLVAALEEERFRRVKHWAGFPTMAIQKCLEIAGISGGQVTHIGVSRNPRANLHRKVLFALTRRPGRRLLEAGLRNRRAVSSLHEPLARALDVPKNRLPKIHYVEHHPAHLASAFFVSPFEDAAVASLDAFGDFVSTSSGSGRDNDLRVHDRVFFPHSLGMMYTAVTQHLGFLGYGDEFKVMGLAPYGGLSHVPKIRKMVHLTRGGGFRLELKYFKHWNEGIDRTWDDGYPTLGLTYTHELETLLGPARKPDEPLTDRHEDIARSLQAVYEECATHYLNGVWERTKNPRLCLAGGCAMNSVANGKVRENTPFKELYIQPAAGDNGTALGAAYYVRHQVLGHPRSFVMRHGYWGTQYDIDRKKWEVNRDGFTAQSYDDEGSVCEAAAKLIADGNVVGWYQGRMEWGARALGNRSIVADPRRADMRELINARIKFREKFRPFAPSILEDYLHDYFVNAIPDPFMQQVYPIRPDKRDLVPAITHVDGSGRLQTVSAETNPRYYALISAFHRLTGVPLVLNTSFNENEPIVDTPEQAFDCFARTRMDAIVLGNTIVRRPRAAGAEPAAAAATTSR
jgi:carbamoyltransferase